MDVFHKLKIGSSLLNLFNWTRSKFVYQFTKHNTILEDVFVFALWSSLSKDIVDPGKNFLLLILVSSLKILMFMSGTWIKGNFLNNSHKISAPVPSRLMVERPDSRIISENNITQTNECYRSDAPGKLARKKGACTNPLLNALIF